MNQQILLIGFAILVISECQSQHSIEATYLIQENIKGRVKQYSEAQYFNPDTICKKYDNKQVFLLDSKGNILEKTHYGGDDEIVTIDNFRYDNEDKFDVKINYNGLQIMDEKTHTTYGIDYIQKKIFYNNVLHSSSISKFDSQNNLIELQVFDENNHLKSKESYSYPNKHLKETCYYDVETSSSDKPFMKVICQYDEHNNIIKENHKSPDISNNKIEDPQYEFKYTYDPQGNWTRKFHYASGDPKPYMREERIYKYE